MIRKLLIANRGEIACRIIRTCRQMGIATVAVYSDIDTHALHVEMADEAVHIGASPATESYLDGEKLIGAAKRTHADAIHPGYGFLSENAAFAKAVRDAGLAYVAPSAEAIAAMGNKKSAKQLLQNIPYIPDYTGDDQSIGAFQEAASEIGYPVMVKAAAGGGGKGMRLVTSAEQLTDAIQAAKREAKQAFNNDTLMLEKAISPARHIEVQVIGDEHGNIIALGDRECSIQRRHQKIVEESPAYGLDPDTRRTLHETAINAAKQLNYNNAGTVEFLMDADGNFYFIEMNTRLQVEHPVTEEVYVIDLVRWQIEIAQGTSLYNLLPPFADEDFIYLPDGHAIEARIYAENPENNFLPVTGHILHWSEPDTVRVDSGVRSGDAVSTYYDPMIAKVIAHAHNRESAIRRLDYALSKLEFLGMKSNVSFLRRVITHPNHIAGNIHTSFLEEYPDLLQAETSTPITALIAAALHKSTSVNHWRNNPNRATKQQFSYGDAICTVSLLSDGDAYTVSVDNDNYSVSIISTNNKQMRLSIDGHQQTVTIAQSGEDYWIHTLDSIYHLTWIDPLPLPQIEDAQQGSLRAPMTGQVIQVAIEQGQMVEAGALLIVLEAMKMEHRITAPHEGVINTVRFSVGDTVQQDEMLLTIIAQNQDT